MAGESEETTEQQIAEDLHDEAFEEAVQEGASADSEITPKPEEKPAEEKKPEEKKVEGAPGEKKEEKVGEEKPVESEEVKALRQQLEDTKRWGTDSAQKVAELTRQIETLTKKPEEIPEEIPDEIKAFYEDYPEFKKAVEFEAKRLLKESAPSSVSPELIQPIEKAVGQMVFDQTLVFGTEDDKGNFIEGHPDGLKIARSKEFREWAKADPDANTNDPIRAINLISRFKETKVKTAVKEHDKETEKEIEERKKGASASISSTKGGSRGRGGADKDDYDSAFEEAARN